MGNLLRSLQQNEEENNYVINSSDLKLRESLGKGATGEVFQADLITKSGTIQVVAAKRLEKDSFRQVDLSDLCRIKHKNIISYLGCVTDVDPSIIVMELGVNGSLFDYLQTQRPKGRLPSSQICTWMSQVSSSVKFIQNLHTIIEAEVKSPNFMISTENVLKLGDFHPPSNQHLFVNPPEQKIRWMAPEVYKEKQRSPKSEVFSCGIVFWEILTSEPPFEGMTRGDIQYRVSGTQQLRPTIPSNCDDALRQLLTDCWKTDPSSRPAIADVKSSVKEIIAKGCRISNQLEGDREVKTNPTPTAICCYAPNKRPHLIAVSTRGDNKKGAIEVYDIRNTNSPPVYTLESPDWTVPPIDLAATRGMLLAIGYRRKYIYQFQKYRSAEKESQKFEIAETMISRYPRCIAVNQRCAVVGVEEKGGSSPGTLAVFSIPSMQPERQVDLYYVPHSLDMNDVANNFIVVMGSNQLSVRNIEDDIGKEISRVSAPSGTEFLAAVFETGDSSRLGRVRGRVRGQSSLGPPTLFAAACTNSTLDESTSISTKNPKARREKGKGKAGRQSADSDDRDRVSYVNQYGWDGTQKKYVDRGTVVTGLGVVGRNGLRSTRDGQCAVSEPNNQRLKIYFSH